MRWSEPARDRMDQAQTNERGDHMTQLTIRQALVECFRTLPLEARRNLAWHAKQKTKICCGKKSEFFTDGYGAG